MPRSATPKGGVKTYQCASEPDLVLCSLAAESVPFWPEAYEYFIAEGRLSSLVLPAFYNIGSGEVSLLAK